MLNSDVSGAQSAGLAQLTDALLCFAPLPELAAALPPNGQPATLEGGDEVNLHAVLVARWLGEEENFAEAKKCATPAQWSVAAAAVETLAAQAAVAPAGEARAAACLRLAEGWATARGKLVFAPLETDGTRRAVFTEGTGATYADVRRRENGLALGVSVERINHALSSHDEWTHALAWWQKAADAAPEGSPTRACALWAALRAMPSVVVASPYTLLRAGETDATQASRHLYDRLRQECPHSREARELAVYYDLAPPPRKPDDPSENVSADGTSEEGGSPGPVAAQPNLSDATASESLPYGEPEYRWDLPGEYGEHPTNGGGGQ